MKTKYKICRAFRAGVRNVYFWNIDVLPPRSSSVSSVSCLAAKPRTLTLWNISWILNTALNPSPQRLAMKLGMPRLMGNRDCKIDFHVPLWIRITRNSIDHFSALFNLRSLSKPISSATMKDRPEQYTGCLQVSRNLKNSNWNIIRINIYIWKCIRKKNYGQ